MDARRFLRPLEQDGREMPRNGPHLWKDSLGIYDQYAVGGTATIVCLRQGEESC